MARVVNSDVVVQCDCGFLCTEHPGDRQEAAVCAYVHDAWCENRTVRTMAGVIAISSHLVAIRELRAAILRMGPEA